MSEQPGKPPADTSWLQTTQPEEPPATIRAAIARLIAGADLFEVLMFAVMFGTVVVVPVAIIIWGAK